MKRMRSATDGYGALDERYEYDAFGTPYTGDLTQGMNLGYTGKAYDAATGLYNYGYRDYAPSVARFTTVDPIRDGVNWFTYVNNDPVNWRDNSGLFPDAMAIRQTILTVAVGGIATPEAITTAAGLVLLGVIIIDDISGGIISQGISDLVSAIISPSAPVRDKEGNPIPPAQQTPPATGKGANAGAEIISNPGDLGGKGFIPPSPEGPKDILKAVGIIGGGGGVGIVVYNVITDDTGAPKDLTTNRLPETSRPPVPWTEPSFSSASTLSQKPTKQK